MRRINCAETAKKCGGSASARGYIHKAQIGFVDECRRLQGPATAFTRYVAVG
jgi:hypothetical protein